MSESQLTGPLGPYQTEEFMQVPTSDPAITPSLIAGSSSQF